MPKDVGKEFKVFYALADCIGGAVFRLIFVSSNLLYCLLYLSTRGISRRDRGRGRGGSSLRALSSRVSIFVCLIKRGREAKRPKAAVARGVATAELFSSRLNCSRLS